MGFKEAFLYRKFMIFYVRKLSYINYFKDGFYENDIKSLTHKLNAIDQKNYNATLNFDNLRKIINNIDLEKLNIIQDQIENYNYKV